MVDIVGLSSPNLLLELPLPTAPGLVLVCEITYIAFGGECLSCTLLIGAFFSIKLTSWLLASNELVIPVRLVL